MKNQKQELGFLRISREGVITDTMTLTDYVKSLNVSVNWRLDKALGAKKKHQEEMEWLKEKMNKEKERYRAEAASLVEELGQLNEKLQNPGPAMEQYKAATIEQLRVFWKDHKDDASYWGD